MGGFVDVRSHGIEQVETKEWQNIWICVQRFDLNLVVLIFPLRFPKIWEKEIKIQEKPSLLLALLAKSC